MDLITRSRLDELTQILKRLYPFWKIDYEGTDWIHVDLKEFKEGLLNELDLYLTSVNTALKAFAKHDKQDELINDILERNELVDEFIYDTFLSSIGIDLLDTEYLSERYTVTDYCNYFDKSGNEVPFEKHQRITETYCKHEYALIINEIKYCLKLFNEAILKLQQSEPPAKPKIQSGLSAYEIALKHYYLVEVSKELKQPLLPIEIGKHYGNIRNAKNIEVAYRGLSKRPQERKPKKKELENILNEMLEYPIAKKAVENAIYALG